MPTYRYICDNCSADDVKFLRMSEYSREIDCPHCGVEKAMKQAPIASVTRPVLKGGGYYETDFKNKN